MEITVPMLREISEGAALKLHTERYNYALAWWTRKGRKKALRAAKKGNNSVTVVIRIKYEQTIKGLLESKGYNAWVTGRGVLFSTIKIRW